MEQKEGTEDDTSTIDLSDAEGAENSGFSDEEDFKKEPLPGSDNPQSTKVETTWWFRRKKAFVGTASTSPLAKILIKNFVDRETVQLLNTMKIIVTKHSNPAQARMVKRNITKLAVKVIILFESQKLKQENFEGLELSFRRICSSIKNAYSQNNINEETVARIRGHIKSLESGLENVIQPYVSQNSMKRLETTVSYLADTQFILTISRYPEFKQVVMVLAHYLDKFRVKSESDLSRIKEDKS